MLLTNVVSPQTSSCRVGKRWGVQDAVTLEGRHVWNRREGGPQLSKFKVAARAEAGSQEGERAPGRLARSPPLWRSAHHREGSGRLLYLKGLSVTNWKVVITWQGPAPRQASVWEEAGAESWGSKRPSGEKPASWWWPRVLGLWGVSENGGGLCLVSTQLARPSMGFLQDSTTETREES